MKILVIGSKGFIGKHVYHFFSEQPSFTSWGVDVVVDYNDPNYFLIDATNSTYQEIFQNQLFDVCVNCSGAASVPDSLHNPLRDFSLNVLNVTRLLEAIRQHSPACKFINLSSAAVYGNPSSLPVSEESKCAPISPYGMHKLMAENICSEYFQFFGIPSCNIRIFSAYGPGLKKQLLWDIYQKTKNSTNLELFGTGKESRDFVYVADIVNAIHAVIEKGDFKATIYNVASGIEVTVAELTTMMFEALFYKGQHSFSGAVRSGDPMNWRADISKLEAIGFKTQYSIKSGIVEYIRWIQEEV